MMAEEGLPSRCWNGPPAPFNIDAWKTSTFTGNYSFSAEPRAICLSKGNVENSPTTPVRHFYRVDVTPGMTSDIPVIPVVYDRLSREARVTRQKAST
jgi:hypothetical protein